MALITGWMFRILILNISVASALVPGNNLSELSLRNTEARIFPSVFRLVDFQYFP